MKNNEKTSEKVGGRFLKMDILKMSNFEKVEQSFCKKFILLKHRAKYQYFNSNVVSIIFQKILQR